MNGANIQAIMNNNTYTLSIHADNIANNSNTLVEHGSNIQTVTDVAVENTSQITNIQSSYAPLDSPIFINNITIPPTITTNNLTVSNIQLGYLSNITEDVKTSFNSINNNIGTINSKVSIIELKQIEDESNIIILKSDVDLIESKQTIDENNILLLQSNVNTINSKLITDENNILLLQSNVNTINNDIGTINSKLLIDESNISTNTSNITLLQNNLINDELNISTNSSNINLLQNQLITDELNILNLQNSIPLLAPITSPNFLLNPTAPTQSYNDVSNKLATTQFVATQINNLINGAPGTLDTLSEIATVLQQDVNNIGTLTNSLTLKAPIDNPSFTGTTNILDLSVTGIISGSGITTLLNPYATITSLSSYALTSSLSIYALASSLSSYLTTATASSTYATITSLSSYALTSSLSSYALTSSLSSYLTTATATSTYATISSLSSYLTSSNATSTYSTITSLNNLINGTTSHTGFTNTGLSTNNRISETIAQLTGASSISASYSSGGIFYIASPVSANFTLALTNIPTTNTYTNYNVSLLINASTNKVYCNSISINGTNITIIYNGGSSNISISSSTMILQQFNIVVLATASTPSYCITSISSIY